MNSFKTTAVISGAAVFILLFVLFMSPIFGSVQFSAIVTAGLIMTAATVACFRHVIVIGKERVLYTVLGVVSILVLAAVIWMGKEYLSSDNQVATNHRATSSQTLALFERRTNAQY